MDINLSTPPIEVTPDDLVNLAARSAKMLERIRTQMLQPFPRKVAPVFPSGKLQELCGIDKARFSYLIKKGELPQGIQEKPGLRGNSRWRKPLSGSVRNASHANDRKERMARSLPLATSRAA